MVSNSIQSLKHDNDSESYTKQYDEVLDSPHAFELDSITERVVIEIL